MIHIGYVLTGVVTTLLGPMLPVLQSRWSLDDAQAGYLFTAQFVGAIAASGAASALIARIGSLRSLVAGYALMCVGVTALGVSPWAVGVASVFCFGLGLGITITTTNLFVSELNPTRRAAALNIVNFTWCIGAVASAPVIGLLAEKNLTTLGLFCLSSLLILLALWLVQFHSLNVADKPRRLEVETKASAFRSPFVLLIGSLIFLYVGTENAVAGWVATYASRLKGSSEYLWWLPPSIFWAMLLIGRLTAPLVLRRVAEERLALAGLATALCGTALLTAINTMAGMFAAVALAGIGFASIYPITVAILPRCFGNQTTRVAGLIFMLAGLGGATLPWAVGFISTRSDSLRAGLLVPLLGNLAMIALQVVIIIALGRLTKPTTKSAQR
ncbi:MAG TPA: MFS transporter [Blastocatellia bacterium]|nr:MFS transporter [Blastocatellia bacterium]